MRILVYCQHVLGIGHLIRTFEILKALDQHQITLILGGEPTGIPLPRNIQTLQLPPLMMDSSFSSLSSDEGKPIDAVKAERKEKITALFRQNQPDILLVELYPFGRNSFHFELEPLLQLAKQEKPSCLIASSVRDILVERDNQVKFEKRAIDRLNTYFDLLLVHSDPQVIRLDETFSRMDDVSIPVVYTGYINRPSKTEPIQRRTSNRTRHHNPLIIASAGGGSVGFSLLEATVLAHRLLEGRCSLRLFTGPYLGKAQRSRLCSLAAESAEIERFTVNFPAVLAQADLSISMGGYNTTMDVLTAGCPALIFPFDQNHEQRLRAERIGRHAPLTVLNKEDLAPENLARLIETALGRKKTQPDILLNGAHETALSLVRAAETKRQAP